MPDWIIKYFEKHIANRYTGSLTFNLHKGGVSHKVEKTEKEIVKDK